MGKVWRKGVPFDAAVAPLVSHMGAVDDDREALQRLQGTWDTLALLGQMSGSMAEIAQTREQFQSLGHQLLGSLANQHLADAMRGLRASAQVVIDVLVRNLFERTADVGFLATDPHVRALVAGGGDRDALEARFASYVAKYSVYDDVVVLDAGGQVLARLDRRAASTRCDEPWVAEAVRPGVPYVERFGATSLLDGRRGLLYAAAVAGGGVLCLSFRFDDEVARLFRRVATEDGHGVVALVDADGRVTASADPWQLPVGLVVPAAAEGQALLRIAGRPCLAVRAPATGYQGYAGPGWSGLALVPVDAAFPAPGGARGTEASALAAGIDTQDIFDETLREIPRRAEAVQRALARSVWNGKLQLGRGDASAGGNGLAAALLREVSVTGDRIRVVFRNAIARLEAAALDAYLEQAGDHARLAIEIVDRNLYERANDCRWWALADDLRVALADPARSADASRVLAHVNGLYTVYALLVLFDASGRVVAVSDPSRAELVGTALDAELVASTLALRDEQAYHVTPHRASPLTGAAATFVYSAALGRAGGIAIVFDGAAQFGAMLRDTLPALPGSQGLLVTRDGVVVASTDPAIAVGSAAPLPAGWLDGAPGSAGHGTVEHDGTVWAVGVAPSGGYREYRGSAECRTDDLVAIVRVPLGQRRATSDAPVADFRPRTEGGDGPTVPIATFRAAGAWYGLPAAGVVDGLADGHITPLPQGRPHVRGVVRWRDEMVAVLELSGWLNGAPAAAGDGALLVCRAASGRHVALRVDALGDVLGIPHAALRDWTRSGDAAPLRLVPGEGAMLTVLDAAEVLAAVGEAAEVAPG